MRILAFAVGGVIAMPMIVHAEPDAAQLQAEGEQLAKDGRFSDAIERFKAADRLEKRASHACLIALAYMRRELWPQAEIFLAECHRRATGTDPLPDWVAEADTQIAERLAGANAAPVTIVVRPVEASAQLTVSSFARDEVFEPRTIHLQPGHHVVFATADGYDQQQRELDIVDTSPQSIVIELHKRPTLAPATPPAASRPASHTLPFVVTGTGVAVTAVGAVLHLAYYKPIRDRLATASDNFDVPTYVANLDEFDKRRTITLAVYGVGIATTITGLVLRYMTHRDSDRVPSASLVPTPGGGMLSLAWEH